MPVRLIHVVTCSCRLLILIAYSIPCCESNTIYVFYLLVIVGVYFSLGLFKIVLLRKF